MKHKLNFMSRFSRGWQATFNRVNVFRMCSLARSSLLVHTTRYESFVLERTVSNGEVLKLQFISCLQASRLQLQFIFISPAKVLKICTIFVRNSMYFLFTILTFTDKSKYLKIKAQTLQFACFLFRHLKINICFVFVSEYI